MPDERALLEARVLEELEELRRGVGATVEAIGTRMTLLDHLGGRTRQDAVNRLVELTQLVSNPKHQIAVKHALGLAGNTSPSIGMRRKPTLVELSVDVRQVQRYEKAGLKALASIIVDKSPARPSARFDDTDVPETQRIADLEMVVSGLMRVLYGMMETIPTRFSAHDARWRQLAKESLVRDMEAFTLSLNKVIWRSSGNARDIALILHAIEAAKAVAPGIETDWVRNREDAMELLEQARTIHKLDGGTASADVLDDEEELIPPKSGDLPDIDGELEKVQRGGKDTDAYGDTDTIVGSFGKTDH